MGKLTSTVELTSTSTTTTLEVDAQKFDTQLVPSPSAVAEAPISNQTEKLLLLIGGKDVNRKPYSTSELLGRHK
jgi:hypothetical protein